MKESVTKFDFESAFKALDEIDIPVADKGIKANKPALTEIFSRKSKFDSLFEEYYDISGTEGLDDAKAAREAEVAKAKLERIEKIVDLDADSPEDLLTSYVGKYIMQCPQCMTLFYKDKEDVVESEDDPSTVNVSEICQHCGNESGYTLVGKVGEAEAEEPAELPMEEPADELDLEIPAEEGSEETTEEPSEDDLEIDLDAINLEDEPAEEEKTEEAFVVHSGEALVEEVQDDKDLKDKLDAHNEYIEYLMSVKTQEEEALEKATNEQVKAAIQRRIDALKADIDAALPNEVKNELAAEETPIEEVKEVTAEEASAEAEEIPVEAEEAAEEVTESLTEALHEETDLDISAEEFEELINSPEFKKPISDAAARAMIATEDEEESEEVKESCTDGGCTLNTVMSSVDELQESALETFISNSLVEAYGNVAGFRLTDCEYLNEKLNVNGTIYFTSGNTRKTTYSFVEAYSTKDIVELHGLNEKLGLDKKFILTGKIDNTNKTFITESFKCNK
jgi:hypothetical protein